MRSVSVVLPESMCALMPMFLTRFCSLIIFLPLLVNCYDDPLVQSPSWQRHYVSGAENI
jgi:hypothetical protein